MSVKWHPDAVFIDQDKCTRCYLCIQKFGCPSFILNTDGSVTVHPDLCNGNGSCIQVCPVQAIRRKEKV
jgi:indolepyruvate ferredoxin oxidoreductase, alpha subunit